MAKLINVLAASIGGGLILGAGLRMLDEASTGVSEKSEKPDQSRRASGDETRILSRLSKIEDRLTRLDDEPLAAGADSSVAAVVARLDAQRAEMESIRSRLSAADRGISEARERGEKSDREIRKWTSDEIGRQITAAQTRLQRDIDHSRRETIENFAEHIQDRLIQRISKLEDEVAGQSTAMTELRECSFRTEQSLQKLLEGIDRLVTAQTAARPAQTSPSEDPAALRRRWGVS